MRLSGEKTEQATKMTAIKKGISLLLVLLLIHISLSGQNAKKQVNALPVEDSPKIDGILEEEVWKNVPAATDFIIHFFSVFMIS